MPLEKPKYAILRFQKYKGAEIGQIEAHNERAKEKYASNPDVDLKRTHLNFHLISPNAAYRDASNLQIAKANCRTRKDSVRLVEVIVGKRVDKSKMGVYNERNDKGAMKK